MTEEEALKIVKARTKKLLECEAYFSSWEYCFYSDLLSEEDFKKAYRLYNRKKARRRRCFGKLAPIIELWQELDEAGIYCNFVFGTCTFNNKTMKWKEETRTKKINKWIKQHFLIAMANIDYGEKNGREHHHFVGITLEKIEKTGKKGKSGFDLYTLQYKNYDLGFEPDLEIITNLDNPKKLSNYLLKINFHSNKKTTRNRRIRLIRQLKQN